MALYQASTPGPWALLACIVHMICTCYVNGLLRNFMLLMLRNVMLLMLLMLPI